MGHSVVRTESRQNHFHSSEISPKRGTTFSRQRQFTSNKINELIHVRQRIVLKMGHNARPRARVYGLAKLDFDAECGVRRADRAGVWIELWVQRQRQTKPLILLS